MVFSDEVIKQAWQRADNKCECTLTKCGHISKCNKILDFSKRGIESEHGWEAHHKISVNTGGEDNFSNCQILCINCHKNTGSYGK